MKQECDNCGAKARTYIIDKAPGQRDFKEPPRLCEVCYSTIAGSFFLYPSSNRSGESADVVLMLAQCTNMILKKIEESKP